MRLVTYDQNGLARLGSIAGDRVVDLAALSERHGGAPLPAEMLAFIEGGEANLERARQLLARADALEGSRPLVEVRLLAPIRRPKQNPIAVGENYQEHVVEAKRAAGMTTSLPPHPIFFTKRATAVNGPEGSVEWDEAVTKGFDWEAELAVVFGAPGKDIPRDRAYEHVYGYTCANDLSARDLRPRHGQLFKGKSLDGSCPLGPWIVTQDELPDPQRLRIICRVNGQVKQDGNTSQMIFDIPTLIAELSAGLTLEPGDLLLTGTPGGVGIGRTPPEFLKPGDVVEVEVEGIGVLRNRIVSAR